MEHCTLVSPDKHQPLHSCFTTDSLLHYITLHHIHAGVYDNQKITTLNQVLELSLRTKTMPRIPHISTREAYWLFQSRE